MSTSIKDINILDLLPQKPPFVMVDRLLYCKNMVTVTELEIREDNLFFKEGSLLASGLIENIAQTCAAGTGYMSMGSEGPVKIGVIGALNNININRLPRKSEIITTTVTITGEVFQMVLFDAIVKSGDEELATASIRTAIADVEAKI